MQIPKESEWAKIDHSIFNLGEGLCVIYFLYDYDGNIIYIGKTTFFFLRMNNHRLEKKNLADVKYFITSQEFAEKIEKDLIEHYKPFFNKMHKPKHVAKTKENKIEKFPDSWSLDEYLEKNEMTISEFSKKSHISEKLLINLLNGKAKPKERTAFRIWVFSEKFVSYDGLMRAYKEKQTAK